MSAVGYAWIALGGALGAMARYAVSAAVQSRLPAQSLPWGTFWVNMSGCFLLGLVLSLVERNALSAPFWRPLVTIGFVGAYTTFSTWEWEAVRQGATWGAFLVLVGSLAGGYGCVWLGAKLAALLSGGRA